MALAYDMEETLTDQEWGTGLPSGDELRQQIIDYQNELQKTMVKSLKEDINLTEHIIMKSYPKWCSLLENIMFYRGDFQEYEYADTLFDNAVVAITAVPQALSRAKLNNQAEKRRWMPILLEHLENLSRAPWLRYRGTNGVLDHINYMSAFRRKNWPLSEAAWEKGRLIGNEDFDQIFAEFADLDRKGPPKDTFEGRRLVNGSVKSVLKAAKTLLISLDDINIPLESLVNEESRPTCVDRPNSDPLFLSGTEKRPGALALKAYLGGPREESKSDFPLDFSQTYAGEKRDFGVFADPEVVARVAKEAENSAKRPALGGNKKKTPSTRKKTTGGGGTVVPSQEGDFYSYTIADADADINDLLREARGLEVRPSSITPVVRISSDVLMKYRSTCLPRFTKFQWAQDAVDAHGPEQLSEDLVALEEEMTVQRGYIVETRARGRFNYNNLKTLKCTTLFLRYLRCLHTRLLMAARPADDLLQARVDRLADWILHEEVWNDANRYSLARIKADSKLRPRYTAELAEREERIEDWRNQILALHKAMAMKGDTIRVEEETSEEETIEEETTIPTPETSHVAETTAPVQEEKKEVDYDAILDKEPERVLDPSRREACKGEKKEQEEEPEFTIFAEGGPPGYKELPQTEVYDKLQYMIILTFWRVLQAQLHN
ncbi:hypothetical protein PG993_011424, partial [Apiospora rasikravindrae]